MALAYKINPQGKTFQILEVATKQIVAKHKTQDLAKKHLRILNLGGGFDGFTPRFILPK